MQHIHDLAVGRWRSILPALGVSTEYLTGKHTACPCCGGKDRFRFDDKAGKGTYFCNGCGAGTGVDLVMKVANVNFVGAVKLIREALPNSEVQIEKAVSPSRFSPADVWKRCHPIERRDPVGQYLAKRGLELHTYPNQIRFQPRARYKHEDGEISFHPAMVAQFVSPDASETTISTTYLTEDGDKADVPKVKKLFKAPKPKGGAVRLAASAETMGIAEGVETALSASCMFGIPVWSALDVGGLRDWEPPKTAKQIVIFADNDGNFVGHHGAYALAYRLRQLGLGVEVKIPEVVGTDWNDEWMEIKR